MTQTVMSIIQLSSLAAVIAAAVAAYEGSASTDGFVVRSIRKSNNNKWRRA